MHELYYFTPFIFINKIENTVVFQTGINFRLTVKYDRKLIEKIQSGNGFTFYELQKWFSDKEIIELFQNNVLVEDKLNSTDRFSRTNGYYMVSQNKSALSILAQKRILILGAGAIGSHVAWMFTTLGIHRMAILDFDVVEKSNLNRQLLYDEEDVGKFKAEVLKKHLLAVNSQVGIEVYQDKIVSKEQLKKYVSGGFDLIVRAIDSPYESVEWLNDICVELKIPYTSGGFLEYYGVVGPTYIPEITPCYSCYENDEDSHPERVYGTGPTISMLTEYVASKVTFEVVNVLTKRKCTYMGKMEVYDSVNNTVKYETFKCKRKCDLCGGQEEKNEKTQDVVPWSMTYLFLIGGLGFIVSLPGWSANKTMIAFGLLSLLTLIFKDGTYAYKISFLGGTLYGIISIGLTLRLNGQIMNQGEYLIIRFMNAGLQIVVTVSLSIVLFVFLTVFWRGIMKLICNFKLCT